MQKYTTLDDVPDDLRTKLDQYFSDVGGDTFVIRNLPPELTGGMLARYSRIKTGIQLTLVNEFLDEHGEPSQKLGAGLMDRVLNAFGDESVGELEGAHVGVENVSQLLTKHIEDRRIGGSPIEESTRYVVYNQKDGKGRWRYLCPTEVVEAGLLTPFEAANDCAFEVYSKGVQALIPHFKEVFPPSKHKMEVTRNDEKVLIGVTGFQNDAERRAFGNSYTFTIRCAALDVGRCVLPAPTLTHLGLFGNGRFYTKLITHLKSSGLVEGKTRGFDLEEQLNTEIPTFIKRNKENPQVRLIDQAMSNLASELLTPQTPSDDKVTLVSTSSLLDETVAACLFPYTNLSLQQIQDQVGGWAEGLKEGVLETYKGERKTRFDRTGRGLEAGYSYTFDLVSGFAEYRDLERHRMLTQQRQPLSTELGFIMPPEMGIVGLESEVEEVVGMIESLNSDMRHAGLDEAAQYATLFNHRMRFTMGMNLRELQHLGELRTQPAGHFSYRSMVMEMVEKVQSRDPWTEIVLEHVNFSDPGNKISRAKEQSKIAGKNLASGIDGGIDLE
tara:strand:+ start:87589 stop:89253 length:1665 start_codon:yes stop_codon:yes gene_type:complete